MNTYQGQDRVIDICLKENANGYINPIGGKGLYDKKSFKSFDLDLSFIQPLLFEYKQYKKPFIPWLSLIDVIMFNSNDSINECLKTFKLT